MMAIDSIIRGNVNWVHFCKIETTNNITGYTTRCVFAIHAKCCFEIQKFKIAAVQGSLQWLPHKISHQ